MAILDTMRLWPLRALVSCAVLVVCVANPRAVDVNLTAETIGDAIYFSRQASRETRLAFHSGYTRTPGDAVRRISLVTEYRRVVLRVEEHRRLLTQNYSVREMTAELKPWRGLMEVIVELQFHPQNTYVQVPIVDVLLVPLDGPSPRTPLIANETDRHPRFGMFWDPPPPDAPWWPFPSPNAPILGGAEPMTGGWVHARFDATAFSRGRYDVVVKDGAKTIGLAEFDLGAIR